jgi:hypothetical protein
MTDTPFLYSVLLILSGLLSALVCGVLLHRRVTPGVPASQISIASRSGAIHHQAWLVMIAVSIPEVCNLLTFLNLNPYPGLDLCYYSLEISAYSFLNRNREQRSICLQTGGKR